MQQPSLAPLNSTMDNLLTGLRAAGELTRLRLLALCAHGELSVTELTQILSQSQPRISRHLKLLVEAGLLTRFREGNLVFYRITEGTEDAHLARTLVDLLPSDDATLNRDLQRLDQIRAQRVAVAEQYFQDNAERWNEIRAMHVPEQELERAFQSVIGKKAIGSFLDIGTGTGRILELLAPQAERGIGIDNSGGMLSLARASLEQAGIRHMQVRKGDMYSLPIDDHSIDLATLHLVLHYSMEPGQVIAEACRTLKPGGRLIIVDFAPHQEEALRSEHQHQRLGFSDQEITSIFEQQALQPGKTRVLSGNPLTVHIWQASKPATQKAVTGAVASQQLH